MADEQTPAPSPEKEVETQPAKKKSKGGSIAAMIIGIVLVVAGVFSFTNNEALNDALIEVGAGQTVMNVVEQYPQTKDWAVKCADIIDAAIAARQSKPEELSTLIYGAVQDYTVPGLKNLIEALVNQINTAYKTSEKEQEYIDKLKHLVTGIRDGVSACSAK